MENEKIRILKMVESGKLRADEAAKLIEALDAPEAGSGGELVAANTKGRKPRSLKIRVYQEGNLSKPKVNIVLPLRLVRAFSKFVPKSAKIQLNEKNINLDDVLDAIDEETGGKILEVHDEEKGEHVEIVVE